MMRYCPNCQSERALAEFYCDGEVNGGPCDWDLSQVAVRPTGWRPTTEADANAPAPAAATCPEGHPLEAGDMICATCGADIVATGDPVTSEAEAEPPALAAPEDATIIAGWHLQGRLASSTDVWERFEAVSEETGRAGVLTLYAQGHEPDPDVYAVLRTLPHDHVPGVRGQ